MATLNNNQMASILKAAVKQSTGSDAIAELDLQGIVDTGNDTSVIGSVEQFTKALLNVVIKNWFTDSSLRSDYKDPFWYDAEEYGGLIQIVSVDVPEVKENSAWGAFTSGTTKVGQYTVYLPIVDTQIVGKSCSYALPITISAEQFNTAFHSVGEMGTFLNYILLAVDNALIMHKDAMSAMNRNNFIGELLAYAATSGATGVHKINLVEKYAIKKGLSSMTVDEFRTTPAALLFVQEQLKLYAGYFQKMTKLFNTAGKLRHTPKDRLVVQVLADLEADITTTAMSDIYNMDIVSLPLHQTVASWQGLVDATTDTDIDFDAVSTIKVKTASDGSSIDQSGIVAFMADRYAIMNVLQNQRVASQHFDIEDLNHYEYQMKEILANNLTQNALVFTLEAYTAG